MSIISGFILCVFALSGFTDHNADPVFQSPVAHSIVLSGSFGELRGTHFHTGIDIKSSNGRVGDPVYAVADGYISRIKVESTGFGQALYITHPNGYTSVYAHLNAFNSEITKYVRALQYKDESFEINHYPTAEKFPICSGEILGQMGNKGSSSGPHLHFELRKTQSENPVNPMLFGISPPDNRAPVMEALKVYFLNGQLQKSGEREIKLSRKNNSYSIPEKEILTHTRKINLGLKIFDRMDGASNRNGVYSLTLFLDSTLKYSWTLDEVSFAESQFIKAHLDFGERVRTRRNFTNCFKSPANRLRIFDGQVEQLTHIEIPQSGSLPVLIRLRDFHGNESELSFHLKYADSSQAETQPEKLKNFVLSPSTGQMFSNENLDISFPAGSVIEQSEIIIECTKPGEGNFAGLILGDPEIPMMQSARLLFKNIAGMSLGDRRFCLVSEEGNRLTNHGGQLSGTDFEVSVSSFGQYSLIVDTIPPQILPVNFTGNMKDKKLMTFRITDNLQPSGRDQRITYRGEIDGHWVLFEYDQKNDLLIYRFDDHCPEGRHTILMKITDAVGNTTQKTYEFEY